MIFTIVLILAFFVLAMRLGKRFLVATVVSFYPAVVIHDDLPYVTLTTDMSLFIALVATWVVTYLLVIRFIHTEFGWGRVMKYVSAAVLSVAVAWIVLMAIRTVAPIDVPFDTESFLTAFMAQIPFGLALILPFLALLVADRD
jgi:hypothetical protein